MLRSLTIKLTLAFLVIGLVGAVLVAVFVQDRTKNEFDQFVLNREQTVLLNTLIRYHRLNQSWQGVEALYQADHAPDEPPQRDREVGDLWRKFHGEFPPAILANADGIIQLAPDEQRVGQKITSEMRAAGLPLLDRDKVIGWVIFDDLPPNFRPQNLIGLNSPEADFIRNVKRAIWLGAAGATVLALIMGIFLARTLTRPLKELTRATKAVAEGDLGHQVPVRSRDELGQLADSFNRMSRDLAEATRQRRQMTADIAHDLRTPLSILLGYTEALSDGKLQGTPEMYAVMHGEAQQLSHLIDDLRTLSLADAGELSLNLQPCRPLDLLARSAAAHQGQAGQKNIALVVAAATDLPAITIDPDRMTQVLGNLISNALRYTPAGGQITLSAETGADKSVRLHVRDTGSGIAPAHLPHILNRFNPADASRQQEQGESGLGLAIAKSIVEAHGGAISADSVGGQGTTFILTFPVAPH
jgi:signal transduction histidine kinase